MACLNHNRGLSALFSAVLSFSFVSTLHSIGRCNTFHVKILSRLRGNMISSLILRINSIRIP